jgi:cytochrome bd-type quinol oxidase subunit 2
VILKLVAIFVFMVAVIVASLWVTLELANAVADGADDVWFLAVGVTLAAALLVLVSLLRSRTRAMVGFMAAATIVLAAVLITYPNSSPPCTPTEAQGQAQSTASDQDLGGILVEDDPTSATTTTATDCS